jgi:hypothetical protein
LFLLVFLAHFASGFNGTGDSRWSIHTALSIVREGNADLDEFVDLVRSNHFYATRVHKGHIYNWYPIGASVLALPAVYVADKVLGRLGIDLGAQLKTGGGPGGMEVLVASLLIAGSAVFIFLMAFELARRRGLALLIALLFAFGTSAWSTASRALWMHGPSIFCLSIALYFVVAARRRPELVQYAALPLAFSFVCRPTNAASIIFLSVYVLIVYRRIFVRFVLWSLPVALPFLIRNVLLFGSIVPPYYTDVALFGAKAKLPGPVGGQFEVQNGERVFVPVIREYAVPQDVRFFEALAGQTVSPGRGLFVFSPFLAFAIWGMVIRFRKPKESGLPRDKLAWCLVATLLLHWALISSFHAWWGGWCFGPRYFSDVLPHFFYFLVPAVVALETLRPRARRILTGVFALLVAISLFAHFRGATTEAVHGNWNNEPRNVDVDPSRLWNFGDIQYLRGL